VASLAHLHSGCAHLKNLREADQAPVAEFAKKHRGLATSRSMAGANVLGDLKR
jgi:hypothetical protein